MTKKKKKHEEEHENTERWLVSYADFITLLFAFFVTMYSVSRVDGKKLGSAVESLQRALGSVIAVQITQREPGVFQINHAPTMVTIAPIQGAKGHLSGSDREAFEKLAKEIKGEVQKLSGGGLAGAGADQIKLIIEKRGLVIRVSEHLFFKSGDASILPEFIPILDILGRALEKVPNHIRIEGHTDSVPIRTEKFPSNWELSTTRATNVLRYLLTHFHFNPENLSATGYGEFRPVDSNQTAAGRFQNRRVDFVILSGREMEFEPQQEKAEEPKESI
ncbi:MAG: flagellar motor protein MotB [Thermodesulfobacteriota bacterium]